MINLKCFDDIEIESSCQFTLPHIKKVKLAPSLDQRSIISDCFNKILTQGEGILDTGITSLFLGDVESQDC